MKRILMFSLALTLVAAVLTGAVFYAVLRGERSAGVVAAEQENKNYLLAGLDDAGDNTDMLMLLSVNTQTGALSFMQIPRDTYLRTDEREGKINQLYRYYSTRSEENTDLFLRKMSLSFSIPIQGYIVFRLEAVEETVDTLGGIPINLTETFVYTDEATGEEKRIEQGKRTLNGRDVCYYIRHRASYAEGDLGRLDAQMRFFSSAFTAMADLKNPFTYLRLYRKIAPKLLTNLSEKDIISLATAFIKNRDGHSVRLMRLPGEATRGNSGSWYYVVNQKAAEGLLRQYFSSESKYRFDEKKQFTRIDRENFMNIYHDNTYKSKVYNLAEAAEIKIIKK